LATSQTANGACPDEKDLHWLVPSAVSRMARDSLWGSLCWAEPVGVIERPRQPAGSRLPDTDRADQSLFHRQEMPLPRPNERLVVVTMRRFLGSEAGHVTGGSLGQCGGLDRLARVAPLVVPVDAARPQGVCPCEFNTEECRQGNPLLRGII
jgi:hypothetical protein